MAEHDTTALAAAVTAFQARFARRQATRTTDFPGGFAVLHERWPASQEHNQLVLDASADPDHAALPALADELLGHLPHRRITVLDDRIGAACLPALSAAGYRHEPEVVMADTTRGDPGPGPWAEECGLDVLLPAIRRQLRRWMPEAPEEVVRQLAERRAARLRGAEQVRFLTVREPDGTVAAWADLYVSPALGLAQIEEVVTAEGHTRRGHGDTLLATARRLAAGHRLFLVAYAEDWPRAWYARRGFTVIGRSHTFVRAAR
ncbi:MULTISPECIES: GNAT family N-acetyltransferase [Streptomycetaceae]|nr:MULTISPECIES: GNAT family N-acetyltransferase [Streptomycetaceae]MYS62383.1 N-acetyltransferase [Streptomyces sp. SID5468]CCB78301.1 Predicted protein [Streptantibioticus cattleyicolor NRRL 8057 = DSM 46488]